MIRLANLDWSFQLEFFGGTIIDLYIENKKYFRSILYELYSQIDGFEGKFILSKDNKEIQINKNIDLIMDFFTINPNSKKLNSKLIAYLCEIVKEDYEKKEKIIRDLNIFFDDLLYEGEFDLNRDENIKLEDLLKLGNFYFDYQEKDSLDKLISYIGVVRKYLRINLFILINARKYFLEEELNNFIEICKLKDFNILFIESVREDFEKFDLDSEKSYIIDKDLCELY